MDWTQLPIGVAAILGLIYVARTMRNVVGDTLSKVATLQSEVLSFMNNHMSNISSSLESVAVNLSQLNERVDRLHDDNLETAKALIEQAKGERAALKEFEGRVRERHMLLAEQIGIRTKVGKALMESITADLP